MERRGEEELGRKIRERFERCRAVHGFRLARADQSASILAASALLFERFVEGRQGHSLGPVGRIAERCTLFVLCLRHCSSPPFSGCVLSPRAQKNSIPCPRRSRNSSVMNTAWRSRRPLTMVSFTASRFAWWPGRSRRQTLLAHLTAWIIGKRTLHRRLGSESNPGLPTIRELWRGGSIMPKCGRSAIRYPGAVGTSGDEQ